MIIYAAAAIWVSLVVLSHVFAAQVLFGKTPTHITPGPIEEPTGPAVAAVGGFALLVSIIYLFIVSKNKDSFWAARFLDFKLFALWFLGGIYLILASKVLDAVISATFGEASLQRLSMMYEGNPKHSLPVAIAAIVLASAATLWYNFRGR